MSTATKTRLRSSPRWATATNQAAAPTPKPTTGPAPGQGVSRTETWRRDMIRDRASRRRAPWIAAGGVAVTSMTAWGVVALFDTVDVPSMATSGVMAAFPLVAAVIAAVNLRDKLGGWWVDLAASAVAAGGLVFWVGLAGPSWLAVLALLGGTLACSARWWNHNAVGPAVPHLQPPDPEPAPEPVPQPEPEPVDEYVVAWDRYNAGKNGKAPNSRLTGREDGPNTISYDVELDRGVQTYHNLLANAEELAGGLNVSRDKLVFESIDDAAPSRARMTIITGNPVADTRFYPGPKVEVTRSSAVITNTARYLDGQGELGITMYNAEGMVPTAIIGKTGGGKSAAGNICTAGALSTGLMNLFYIDPKGNSSSALRKQARIAIIGPANAARAPELVHAILEARRAYTVENDIDKLKPSTAMPGWELLHDEFSELVNRGYMKAAKAWCSTVNTVRSLGIWPVALSQAMQESKWGDDQTRSAFCTQLVVFRMKTGSDNLVPGLEYRPHNLPKKAGMAVYAFEDSDRSNVPVRWDWLPSDSDCEELDEDPPYSTSTALAEFDDQPDLHEVDYQAIVSVLGPPVDGRWVVGPGGTHSFPDEDSPAPAASAPMRRKPTGFGVSKPSEKPAEQELTQVQRDVLAIVEGGTTRAGEIEQAVKAARSTVREALDELTARGLLRKPERAVWEVVPQD